MVLVYKDIPKYERTRSKRFISTVGTFSLTRWILLKNFSKHLSIKILVSMDIELFFAQSIVHSLFCERKIIKRKYWRKLVLFWNFSVPYSNLEYKSLCHLTDDIPYILARTEYKLAVKFFKWRLFCKLIGSNFCAKTVAGKLKVRCYHVDLKQPSEVFCKKRCS